MTDRPRILVADDDQGIAWMWARLLQWEFDAEVVVVFDGTTALARANERFGLVISDLQMPGVSGMDVVTRVLEQHPRTPVILATAGATDEVLAHALRVGVRQVLGKPFGFDEAVCAVAEALGQRRVDVRHGSDPLSRARSRVPLVRRT